MSRLFFYIIRRLLGIRLLFYIIIYHILNPRFAFPDLIGWHWIKAFGIKILEIHELCAAKSKSGLKTALNRSEPTAKKGGWHGRGFIIHKPPLHPHDVFKFKDLKL
jgi:hypothetical protein